ncbi:tyrosine-type recombinase/integrase [Herbiconiux daphne]|uniref:Tyrosine-type recombinase/integrase n=1 Tax=Herbiconiux daphne TaxID=2970914 RepID=A0ABT2H066_9MICO|nr:tyrosine-type recombinase/integrase [Herbiconiux daphne]MCS5732716.1 tyrosine-type recombinase/integrase [Herbiconiux daphne]
MPLVGFLVDEIKPLIDGHKGTDYVFRTVSGDAIHDHNWRTLVWTKAVAGAGLDELGITPHKLRHTAASMAIAAGADVKLVQRMLGHKDATETLNTYGHLWPDRLDEVTTALEKARSKALSKSKKNAHDEQIMTTDVT